MSETDLFRNLLDEQGIPYEIQDFKSRRCTYIEDTLDGEPFAIEFDERRRSGWRLHEITQVPEGRWVGQRPRRQS